MLSIRSVESGLFAVVPPMPAIAVDNARSGYFEPADLNALLLELPAPLRAAVSFAYWTGWRMKSEIVPLRWSQVDLDGGFVRLESGTTKSKAGREFPAHALPEMHQRLREQRARTPANCSYVFHRGGAPIKNIRTAWKNATARAKLSGRVPHDFRRTAVRNLERAGVSQSVARQLVGHKTVAIYNRYAIVAGADLAAGVAKLAKGAAQSETAAGNAGNRHFSHNLSPSGEGSSNTKSA
jgi:integrase